VAITYLQSTHADVNLAQKIWARDFNKGAARLAVVAHVPGRGAERQHLPTEMRGGGRKKFEPAIQRGFCSLWLAETVPHVAAKARHAAHEPCAAGQGVRAQVKVAQHAVASV
jgi:hypothetical protein